MVRLLERETIYRIASQAFERSGHDAELFDHFVRTNDRVRGLSPFMIAMIVRMAFILFRWWIETKVEHPSEVKHPIFPQKFEETYAFSKYQEESDHD